MSELLERLGRAVEGRYRVRRVIGTGGMAMVCLADDLKHGRPVAIKVMKPEIADGLGARRFLREIETVAQLSHPNILPLHDSGESDGLLYFVMPFVEGETLRKRLRDSGRLPVDESVRIASEVAEALGHAHERGLIHRDIKPENILFLAGHAVVTDFGIARVARDAGAKSMTETGMAVGTLTYMSPEQAAGETDLDARSDVYSLGCVLYEMLTGTAPFSHGTPQRLLALKVTQPPPSVSGAQAEVPVTLDRVLAKALATEPGDRFETPGALAGALRRAATEEAIVEESRRRRHATRVRFALVGLAVAALGTAAWWMTSRMGWAALELVAVLPLENAANDPEQDFFVAGVHTDLIQELSRADVRVISPTSVLRYRDMDLRPSEVASELQVDAVIEGSTSLVGDSVSLDLRLTDGATDELIWFGSFGAPLAGVMSLYGDATRAIAARIGVELRPEVESQLATAREVSPEVYQALLRARFYQSQVSELGLAQALDYYGLALARDPANAEAFAGIASVWTARAQNGYVSSEEARARGEPALAQAAQLDSTLAAVQFTLAAQRTWGAWDWEAGERSFRQTLAADPTNSTARAYYSQLLHYLGRDDEAGLEIARAVREDPFNPQIQTLHAMDLNYLHDYDSAAAVLSEVLERSPGYGMALTTLRTTYHLMGRHEDALEMWRASDAGDAEVLDAFDRGYELGGYEGALRGKAELLVARSDTTFVTPWQIGTLYTRAGDRALALDYLERAFEVRDQNIPYLSVDPIFDDLRDEPRFQALIARLDLDD